MRLQRTMKKLVVYGLVSVFAFIGSVQAAQNSLVIKGSTTVLPIAQAAAEVFMDNHQGVDISVQGGGSGVGIASLIDGTTDIGDASRPIKDQELAKAVKRGVDPKAHIVAMDGIAVIVNPANTLQEISLETLNAIYTGKISKWEDVPGGKGGKIIAISRDSASGTYEAFNELALDKARVRPDALLQASNQAVASTVARTPGAIGYIGLGFVNSQVKALPVNGIVPSKETVLKGTYVLARPLFMYTNGKPKGIQKEFIDFVLSQQGQQLAEEAGYIGLQ